MFFCDGLDNNNRRGVLIYVAADIQATVVESPSAFQECVFLLLKGRGTKSCRNQLLVGNIYRSPGSKQDNDNELFKLLSDIQQKYNVPKPIVGDFNFSNIKWYDTDGSGVSACCSNLSDNELKFVSALRENLLFQHVVQPTRQRGSDMPHTLDLIITSDNFLTDVEHLSPLGMSDHSVLKFSLQMFVDRVSADDKFRWDKGDYSKLCELLDINWDDILDVSNATVDEMWKNFKDIVIDGMNLFVPRGNQRLKRGNKNHQPFSNELKRLINDKHRLWKKWIASRDRTVYDNYKKYVTELKK